MAWSNNWNESKEPPAPTKEETDLISEAKDRFKRCEDWEAQARLLFEYDYKFANADAHNKYQWDSDLVLARELDDKPCLTINKTQQHNLAVINDAKQNKPGIRIRPVGDEATFEGAQIYQELVYHTEYISNAETIYDSATSWQVQAGIGYWRIITDYISEDSFDQEIYIRHIKDPRSVYLDPDINEVDGSDARFGFVFEDMPKELFDEKYPDFKDIGSQAVLGNKNDDNWVTKDNIRICEYFKKEEKQDKLVTFIIPETEQQILIKLSKLEDQFKPLYNEIKKRKDLYGQYQFKERKIVTNDIEWIKLAGDRIISRQPWLGKYIPIVRLVGTETVIDGILDRKGHTRALINAQQIYNYNTSANVEYGALQTKAPWIAATAAIEGYEEYYKTANRVNHSYLPYNAMDEDGNKLEAPTRPASPQSSPAYVQQMQIAQNEMMMVTGQYQAQFGEAENAKSGVAINARQRQGDRATYHFIDNQAIAIRYTGKILIDLYPKIYDTVRVKKIMANDGSRMHIQIDPKFAGASKNIADPNAPLKTDEGQLIKEYVFNPSFGMYDIQSDSGPSFATKRMEAFNALSQIAATNKEFMNVAGDILWRAADFPDADKLAERWARVIPPNVKGEGPDPQTEQLMQQAIAKIEQLTGLVAKQAQDIANKEKNLTIRAQELDLKFKDIATRNERDDYKAETERMRDIFNTSKDGEGVAPEVKQVLRQLIQGMLNNGELQFTDNDGVEPEAEMQGMEEEAGMPEGARLAPDGQHYIENPEGGYSRVEMQ